MRIIKYNVWNPVIKIMLSYEKVNLEPMCKILNTDLIPLEFTGLLDKNEREIYEGDILKNTKHKFTFKVQWGIEGESYAGWAGNWNEKDFISPLYNGPLENCKIIGNIYENPELLNPIP